MLDTGCLLLVPGYELQVAGSTSEVPCPMSNVRSAGGCEQRAEAINDGQYRGSLGLGGHLIAVLSSLIGRLGTLDFGHRTLDFGPWTLDIGLTGHSVVFSIVNRQ